MLLLLATIAVVNMTPVRAAGSVPKQPQQVRISTDTTGESLPPAGIQWAKTYGGSSANHLSSLDLTSDGGYIVAGNTMSFGAGGYDVWVLKLNSTGSVVWQKTFGGAGTDGASSVQQTSDGGYVVAAYESSFGAGGYDAWILKLDSNGSVVWQKTYGGTGDDFPQSILQTLDGGYIVAGYTDSYGAGSGDFCVFRLNSTGSVEWQKTYGGSNFDGAYSICEANDGTYAVTGETDSFGAGNADFWVLKLKSDGSILWQMAYGGVKADLPKSIQHTLDGGYIVAGITNSFGAGNSDVWVLKLNSEGSVVWQKTYGGTGDDAAYSVQQTSDGGYIVAGTTNSFGAGNSDVWVLKLNSTGGVTWQKTYGGTGDDFAYAVKQTSDSGYVVAGWTVSFGAESSDGWVFKLNSSGSVVCDGGVAVLTHTTNITPADSHAIITTTSVTPEDINTTGQSTAATTGDSGANGGSDEGGSAGSSSGIQVISVSIPVVLAVALVFLRGLVYVVRTGARSQIPERGISRAEAAVTEKPVVSVITPDVCPYCGAHFKVPNAMFCWNCGGSLETGQGIVPARHEREDAMIVGKCMVCNLDVKKSDIVALCPYCGNIAHKTHMLEWLHVKNYCPICRKHLTEKDL
jgi:uncharacterized delta-60 repeat protein